jgi:outer membrane lipoprotein carrier protein
MNKIVISIITVFTFFSAFAQTKDPQALEILDKMSAKYKEMSGFKATFSYTLESPSSKINENYDGDITVKSNKFRLKMGGQEIINNSTTVWTYLKESNEVNISNYEPEEGEINPTEIYTIYQKGFKYLKLEDLTENGVVYEIIDLVPEDKDKPYFKIRLTINKKDKTLKGWKIFEKSGNRYIYNIKNFAPNAVIDDKTFIFDKTQYKGVQVVDLR